MLNLDPHLLRDLRISRAWTQTDLADHADLDLQTVSRIETGKVRPRPSTVRRLADAFQIEPAALMRSA